MNIDDYLEQAKTTAVFNPNIGHAYLALGLSGEAGEVAGKVKKILRGDPQALMPGYQEQVAAEVGDVMWYAAMLIDALGMRPSRVLEANLAKLAARREAGTIKGAGDHR